MTFGGAAAGAALCGAFATSEAAKATEPCEADREVEPEPVPDVGIEVITPSIGLTPCEELGGIPADDPAATQFINARECSSPEESDESSTLPPLTDDIEVVVVYGDRLECDPVAHDFSADGCVIPIF